MCFTGPNNFWVQGKEKRKYRKRYISVKTKEELNASFTFNGL